MPSGKQSTATVRAVRAATSNVAAGVASSGCSSTSSGARVALAISARILSVERDNHFPPRMAVTQVFERGAGLVEWIAPVDHRLQLAFARQRREKLQVRLGGIGNEESDAGFDERAHDLAPRDPLDRPEH